MPNDIFTINNNKSEESFSYTYYTIFGDHSSLDKDNNPTTDNKKDALAYSRLSHDNIYQYFIKIGTYGKVFNPMGMYSEGRHNKFLSKAGKNEYSFTKVNQKVFDMYLNFLRTKNIAWLNNAERELA